jgi:Protein kinase domain
MPHDRTATFPPGTRLEDVVSGAADTAPVPTPGAHFKPVDAELYQRKEPLASGGMGRTFTAVDLRLGRRVVLKELPDPAQELPAGVRDKLRLRLEQESRILAGLQHPNIVTVYEAGVWTDGEPFYAMSFVQGRELERAVQERETLEQRLALLPALIAVSEAVAYAHGQGIIHRDLTPKNILIGDYGDAVIIDWGIAKVLGTEEADVSLPGVPVVADGMTAQGMGVPAYACPEQIAGKDPDERFDVYSMGATLYFVLAGAPPFSAETMKELIARVIHGVREPLPPGIPQELGAIVDKAMHRELDQRYRSARELADELRAFQSGWLVGAHRYSLWARGRKWLQRRWRAVLVVVAVLVALGAMIGLYYYQGQSEQAESRRAAAQRQAQLAGTAQQRSERLKAMAETAAQKAGAAAQKAAQTAEASRQRASSLSKSLAKTRKQRSWALRSRKQALTLAKREAELKAAAFKARQDAEAAAKASQQARQLATSLADQARAAQKKATTLAATAQREAGEATDRARKSEEALAQATKRLAAANRRLAAAQQQTAAQDKELKQARVELEGARLQLRHAATELAGARKSTEEQRRQLTALQAQVQQAQQQLKACQRRGAPPVREPVP